MYITLLIIIYLAFVSLGLPDSLLGSAWPTMYGAFNVPVSYAGMITMTISGGTILSGLFSERLTKKFSTKYVTVFSVFLTVIALFGFSTVKSFPWMFVWAIPLGLGAGAIDAALNNYVALYYSSKHMNWLHCFWGVGTVISPYIMSGAIINAGWQSGYRTVAFLQLAIGIILIITLPLWKVNKGKLADGDGGEVLGFFGVLKMKGVPNLLIGFFAYCAAEATMMLWSSSYLVNTRGISAELAAAFGSLFFIGMTVGRFISGFVSEKLGDKKLIRIGTCVIMAGIMLVALPVKNDIFSLAGIVVMGLGCAPIYPAIVHSTPVNFGKEKSQAIIGIQMASAYTGSTFMPPVFGFFAAHTSMKMLPLYAFVFFGFMIIMLEKTFRIASKEK